MNPVLVSLGLIFCFGVVVQGHSLEKKITCENALMTISCSGTVITIKSAFYGRIDKTTCAANKPRSQLKDTSCSSSTAFSKVHTACDGKEECSVWSKNGIFGDPCQYIYKYLVVEYYCGPASYGKCSAWGDPHYTTFDNERHHFQGRCSYYLIYPIRYIAPEIRYTISSKLKPIRGGIVSLTEVLSIEYLNHTLFLQVSNNNRPRIMLDTYNINGQRGFSRIEAMKLGVRVFGNGVKIMTDSGITVWFYNRWTFIVNVPRTYFDRTAGLCGQWNGDPSDDLTGLDGVVYGDNAAGWFAFGNTWRKTPTDMDEDECVEVPPEPNPCDSNTTLQNLANDFCRPIYEHSDTNTYGLDLVFADCLTEKVVEHYEGCLFDFCHGGQDDICVYLLDFGEDCAEDVFLDRSWKNFIGCGVDCGENGELTQGVCPRTCDSVFPEFLNYEPCIPSSELTCNCKEGYVYNQNGDCVPDTVCNCMDGDVSYQHGYNFTDSDCNHRKCEDGTWVVEYNLCKRGQECVLLNKTYACQCLSGYFPAGNDGCITQECECRATGDPHFYSCDRRRFDFQGQCEYYLVQSLIKTSNMQKFDLIGVHDPRRGGRVSVTKMVKFRYYADGVHVSHEITILYGRVVKLNGHTIGSGLIAGTGITISRSWRKTEVRTNFGLHFTYRGTRLYIYLDARYKNKIGGLCGPWDDNPLNDFQLRNGTPSNSANDHGDSWIYNPNNIVCGETSVTGPCDDVDNVDEIKDTCEALRTKFQPLLDAMVLSPQELRHVNAEIKSQIDNCIFDLCAEAATLCDYFESLAQALFELTGHESCILQWIIISGCGDTFSCDEGMVPADATTMHECSATCTGEITECDPQECVCEPGKVLTVDNRCVDPSECRCSVLIEDLDYTVNLNNGGNASVCGYDYICVGTVMDITGDGCESGYTCSVDTNYECIDIDECKGVNDCDDNYAACTNIPGSYSCQCITGYSGDGTTCIEINECQENSYPCGQTLPMQICVDGIGSYHCLCPSGYFMENGVCKDTDECYEGIAECHAQATCQDTDGSYNCVCNYGYTGDGNDCVDINECLQHGICEANEVCVNIEGSYTCRCADGYMLVDNVCIDIDECTRGTNNCSINANCNNYGGGYDCACKDGFSGDGEVCNDIDECANANLNNCDVNARCTNHPGYYTCSCNVGYDGPGENCADINECLGSVCDGNAQCTNTDGSYNCECNEGYQGSGYIGECTDIDECVDGTHSCDPNAQCFNTPGGLECICRNGFTGDGENCDDVDECALGTDDCSSYAECINTISSYRCECVGEFTGDGRTCTDINECNEGPMRCGMNAYCQNFPGGFDCFCNSGFDFDSYDVCVDVDECTTPDKCGLNGVCINTVGSFRCGCRSGYERAGTGCQDIDECQRGTDTCDSNAVCTNTEGSFSCQCRIGYNGNGHVCTDINECQTGAFQCDVNADCHNVAGSYYCVCLHGYTGNGNTCTDIDECAENSDNCPVNSKCINSPPGSYTCACFYGYGGDNCDDINECEETPNTCGPHAACVNSVGSYRCICDVGYHRLNEGHYCTDQNECVLNHGCDMYYGSCTNTEGSYECSCNSGYAGDGYTCEDINECEMATGHNECDDHAVCENTIGGMQCHCNTGYSGDGRTCTDDDECADPNICGTNKRCINNPGSYACECEEGYEMTGSICTDINECDGDNPDICPMNAECINDVGSYTCPCLVGYEDLNGECIDIDECVSGDHDCHAYATCINTGGSYTCECHSGYTAVEEICVDDDECTDNTDNCHSAAGCTNTPGGFNCECNPGYSGNGVTCSDIDECQLNIDNCHMEAQCQNNAGGFTCECNDGFEGNGITCTDIDECETNRHHCSENAICENSYGSFCCHCTDGYRGPGDVCTDIDECTEGTHSCPANTECHNLAGSYDCICVAGYVEMYGVCQDVIECANDNDNECHENAGCTNTDGSYTCTCNTGYHGNGFNCEDINECTNSTNACDDNAHCQNTEGSLLCSCISGYQGDGFTCEDRDECEDTNACNQNADCNNNIGSYTCQCQVGYSGNGFQTCDDINECDLDIDQCHDMAYCNNNDGGYTCTCKDGFEGNGFNCSDFNECSMDSYNDCDGMRAICINYYGTYDCECRAGYIGDGTLCDDDNECDSYDPEDLRCDENAFCTNTEGSYGCTCNTGYSGNGISCTDVNECVGTNPCGDNAQCTNNAGSFSCACLTGYESVENICTNINECLTGAADCPQDSECRDTPGDYECLCLPGFRMSQDRSRCYDINECRSDPCSSPLGHCFNYPGGYHCSCKIGWEGDGRTCHAPACPRHHFLCRIYEVRDPRCVLNRVTGEIKTVWTWCEFYELQRCYPGIFVMVYNGKCERCRNVSPNHDTGVCCEYGDICVASGDILFYTFNKRVYNFNEACRYVFARHTFFASRRFTVLIDTKHPYPDESFAVVYHVILQYKNVEVSIQIATNSTPCTITQDEDQTTAVACPNGYYQALDNMWFMQNEDIVLAADGGVAAVIPYQEVRICYSQHNPWLTLKVYTHYYKVVLILDFWARFGVRGLCAPYRPGWLSNFPYHSTLVDFYGMDDSVWYDPVHFGRTCVDNRWLSLGNWCRV